MTDIGSLAVPLLSMLSQGWFWGLIIVLAALAFFVALKFKRKRKLNKQVLIVTQLAGNKIGLTLIAAGWISKRRIFRNLIELKGEEEFITKDYRKIYGFDTEDFNELNGKKVVIVTPNPENPDQLFPISNFELDKASKQMLMKICPMDITEVAGEEFKSASNELKDNYARVMELIGLAVIVVAFILAMVFITQYWKTGLDHAQVINQQTNEANQEMAQNLVGIINSCGNVGNLTKFISNPGGAP